MLKKRIRYLTLAIFVLSSMMLTGCIPANDHVGKAPAHSYKSGYGGYGGYGGSYGSNYYNDGYYR